MKRILAVRIRWILLAALALTATAPVAGQPPEDVSTREATAVYGDAANFQNNGAFELALEEWTKFLTKFPKDPLAIKAKHYQGVCMLQLKQFDKAAAVYESLIKTHPKFEFIDDAYVNLGWCQYSLAQANKQAADYQKAAVTFAQLVKAQPNSKHVPQALFFQGESLYLAGKVEESVAPYRTLLETHKDNDLYCDAAYALGVAYEELKDYGQAQKYYDQFLSKGKEHPLTNEVKLRKADAVLLGGDPKAAEQLFAEVAAITGFASADHALYRQAYCASTLDKFKEAGGLYAQLVAKFPNSGYKAEAMMSAGRAFYRAQEAASATEWFQKVVTAGKADVIEASHWLCRLHLAAGDAAKALAVADAALPKAGDDKFAANLLLDKGDALYADPAKRVESQQVYLKVVNDYPKHSVAPQSLYNAAFGALESKKYADSVSLAGRFLAEYAESELAADVKSVRAEGNLQREQYEAAAKDLRELVAAAAEHPEAPTWKVRLGTVLYLEKKYAEAEQWLTTQLPSIMKPEQQGEALFVVAACQYYQKKYEPAVATAAQAEKADPKGAKLDQTLLIASRSLQKLDRLEEALKMAQRSLAEFPASAVRDETHYRLGEFQYGLGQFAEAIKHYDQVAATNAASTFAPFALYGKGWSQLKSGAYPMASAAFTQLLTQHAMHELVSDTYFARAMSRRQEGNFKGALEDVAAFLQTKPMGDAKSDALYERGLAQVGLQDGKSAIATFGAILGENPMYPHADKVLYELAWAYKTSDDAKQAVATFGKLAKDYANSDLSAEAWFHVGEDHYLKEAYPDAQAAYAKVKGAASQDVLLEKAVYKLGWALYQQEKFTDAMAEFNAQAERHPEGALTSDAIFMSGECAFKLKDYATASQAFAKARTKKPSSETIAVLLLLHSAQSGNQLKQWAPSETLLTELITKYPKSIYLAEAYFERGRARENQNKLADAKADYLFAAENSRAEVGARAGFMLGEVLFAEKQYAEAVRRFQRVMFGFGADKAPEPIRNWQAKSAFEAGRCSEVLINQSQGQDKSDAIADGKKFYDYVIRTHPRHELAATAKKRLDVLQKL